MKTGAIDWVQLRENMILTTKRIELYNPTYWNKEANVVNENLTHWAELTKKQVKQLPLSSEFSVLDVGAGTGRMTLPIAKRVRHVTALEPSKKMLTTLRENAREQQVFNIFCINETLELLEINCSYDLVVASFSLFMFDIKSALLKMNSLASKGIFLFLSASPWVDAELQKALYGKVRPWSDFVFIYNILHDAGILANVTISDYEIKQGFTDLEDAVLKYSQTCRIPVEKKNSLREYLRTNLVEENEKLWCNCKRKMATIWWTKSK
jgi:SAM-dependent methyltransferase